MDAFSRRVIDRAPEMTRPSATAQVIAAGELELAADNTHDLPSVPTWHEESIIIIGDAAHAPSATSA